MGLAGRDSWGYTIGIGIYNQSVWGCMRRVKGGISKAGYVAIYNRDRDI